MWLRWRIGTESAGAARVLAGLDEYYADQHGVGKGVAGQVADSWQIRGPRTCR
jgi:hypothetical protein